MKMFDRVLIIDDDVVDRKLLRRELRIVQSDVDIWEEDNGKDGLKTLRNESFDCAFLDYRLPPSDGLTVLREARIAGIDTPIIVLTGRGSEELASEVVHEGASDYINKASLSAEVLRASMRFVTQVRRAELELKRLASFPEQAPHPIFEVTYDGSIGYLNSAASSQLDGTLPNQSDVSIVDRVLALSQPIIKGNVEVLTEEIELGEEYYHLTVRRVAREQKLRVYGLCISDRKRAEQQLTHSAFFDLLTELPNRALFLDRLERSLRHAQRHSDRGFAVLLLDLDRFKNVNDSFGHLVGDELLVACAARLKKTMREEDTVARIGGDEYAVLVVDPPEVAEVTRIAERILGAFSTPFRIGGRDLYSSVSIGIALSSHGYLSPVDVLRDADIAMYRAKARGGGCMQVFDTAMHEQAVAVMRLETELRHAVELDQLAVLYQPVVELESGRIIGLEALVRWDHPTRGLVRPGTFVQVAEELGIVAAIDRWVLEHACFEAGRWLADLELEERPFLAVNFSSHNFVEWRGDDEIRRILESSRITERGVDLILEITETALMRHVGEAARVLSLLRPLGVRVSVDDFGTGYSSLSYLRRLPIDTLKVDRTFVQEMVGSRENTEIIRAIVGLANNLDLQVVAEGIETSEQLERLLELGCRFGQGYQLAPPLRGEEVRNLLTTGLIEPGTG